MLSAPFGNYVACLLFDSCTLNPDDQPLEQVNYASRSSCSSTSDQDSSVFSTTSSTSQSPQQPLTTHTSHNHHVRSRNASERGNSFELPERWLISSEDLARYQSKFEHCKPVRREAISISLAMKNLTRDFHDAQELEAILKLADFDKDGCLDLEEFAVAEYLCENEASLHRKNKKALPPLLVPLSKRKLSQVEAMLDTSVALPRNKWQDDFELLACQNCRREFTLLRRKHHCRLCGQAFCHECSKYRAPLYETIESTVQHDCRVCGDCSSWLENRR